MSGAPKFRPATRAAVKMKVLIDGPSGSGKTYGALAIAEGLAGEGGRIALIDSEHERASFYADRFVFDTLALDDKHADRYTEALEAAILEGYNVVVIDSLSHAWLDLLERKDRYESENPRSNRWTNWALFSPAWDKLLLRILQSPVHVICTARSKQAYEQQDAGGKKAVVKLGLQPQVRDGTEYEFALVFSLEQSHRAVATKDNTHLFPPKAEMIDLADGRVATALHDWIQTAKPVMAPELGTMQEIVKSIAQLPEAQQDRYRKAWAKKRLEGCTEDEAQDILNRILAVLEREGVEPPAAPAAPPVAAEAPKLATKMLAEKQASKAPAPAAPDPAPPTDEPPAVCPKCGSTGMRDDRKRKRNPKAPDFRCQAKSCDGVLWPGQWPPKVDPAQQDVFADGEPVPVGAGEDPASYEDPGDDLPF